MFRKITKWLDDKFDVSRRQLAQHVRSAGMMPKEPEDHFVFHRHSPKHGLRDIAIEGDAIVTRRRSDSAILEYLSLGDYS